MPRFWRLLLISFVIVILLYGIYFALGRPVIPLPAIHYNVYPGQPLHAIVTADGTNQLKLTLNTSGEVELTSAIQPVLTLNYTPDSFENTLDLAQKILNARKTVGGDGTTLEISPIVKKAAEWTIAYYYHIIRFRISVLVKALP